MYRKYIKSFNKKWIHKNSDLKEGYQAKKAHVLFEKAHYGMFEKILCSSHKWALGVWTILKNQICFRPFIKAVFGFENPRNRPKNGCCISSLKEFTSFRYCSSSRN